MIDERFWDKFFKEMQEEIKEAMGKSDVSGTLSPEKVDWGGKNELVRRTVLVDLVDKKKKKKKKNTFNSPGDTDLSKVGIV